MSKRNFSVSLRELEADERAIGELEMVLAERRIQLDSKRKRFELQNENSLVTTPDVILEKIILESDRETVGRLVQTNRRFNQYWNIHKERIINILWEKEYGAKFISVTDKIGWWSSIKEPSDNSFQYHKDVLDCKLPPGEYYVGDICYVLDHNVYDDIWGTKFKFEDGKYTINYDGYHGVFAVASTAHGDGTYRGSNGKYFDVDAGVIGIVSRSLCAQQETGEYEATFIKSTDQVQFKCNHQHLFIIRYKPEDKEIQQLRIKTG